VSLTRLSLTDFRSYADALIVPGPGLVILTGNNGAGKTNVLEAISLLAPGRGLRAGALSEMARLEGPGGFGVGARLGDIDIGTGTTAELPERRVVRINGAAATATALGDWISLVWLTPVQDRLFTESAGARRRFLDRLVLALDPAHARDASRYEAAMRQRNRLLAGERLDREWLTALEAAMVVHGRAIAARRAEVVEKLRAMLSDEAPGPFARAALSLEGFDHKRDYANDLSTGRDRDAAAGRTLLGPHRQDLVVAHLDKGVAAASCSTGEQKALLIGIVLAHVDLVTEAQGRRPVLLLDEVAAHLDPLRRAALLDRLSTRGGQAWLTGTEPGPFVSAGAGTTWLNIQYGRVVEFSGVSDTA